MNKEAMKVAIKLAKHERWRWEEGMVGMLVNVAKATADVTPNYRIVVAGCGATWFAKTLHHSGGRVMWAVVGTKHYTGTGDTLAEAQLAALATLARGLAEDVHEQVSDQAAWALAQVTQDLVALLGVTSMEVT